MAVVFTPYALLTFALCAFIHIRRVKDEFYIAREIVVFCLLILLVYLTRLFLPDHVVTPVLFFLATCCVILVVFWPAYLTFHWDGGNANIEELSGILRSPVMRDALHAFMIREWSIENLLFLETVEKFTKNPSIAQVDLIWEKFFETKSLLEINISNTTRETTRRNIATREDLGSVFEEARGKIYRIVAQDTLPRFIMYVLIHRAW